MNLRPVMNGFSRARSCFPDCMSAKLAYLVERNGPLDTVVYFDCSLPIVARLLLNMHRTILHPWRGLMAKIKR